MSIYENIKALEPHDADYPMKLKEFLKDPKKIYYTGDLKLADAVSIAVVGSRACSAYGRAIATEIGRRATAFGVNIVSGLAKGIDGAAHLGVLDSGGRTIGVIANGLDIFYPYENRNTQRKIAEEGLLISEYPVGEESKPWYFLLRNRIISALSDAVIVVEANTRSGSLITAECAIEQGKEVYAVPGNIMSQNSLGTNKLIADGARPLYYIDQVFHELIARRILKPPTDIDNINENTSLGEREKELILALKNGGELSMEDLSHKLKISIAELNGLVSVLEIKGIVFSEMGKVMIAKSL